jgi:putative ABC transport system permease protein
VSYYLQWRPSGRIERGAMAASWFESAGQDVRYAIRSLSSEPGFTAVALLTLALGVAAATAIFSTVNATLLRPLPYVRSSELVDVRTRLVDGRVTTGLVSAAELELLKNMPALVDRAAGHFGGQFDASVMRDDGAPLTVKLSGVSEGFFDLLGVPMALGRSFTPDEHVPAGRDAPFSIVLSDAAWARLYGRDPSIIGKTIRMAELPPAVTVTVIGVASPLVDLPRAVDLWFNGRSTPQDTAHVINVVVRLKPGATIEQLFADGNAAMKELGKTVVSAEGREWVMQPLVNALVGDLGPVLLIALGATALLLVVACVNVTNLLLARGVRRTREMALRSALGAAHGRIIRQLLTESLVLAAAGAVLGFGLAVVAVRVLLALGGSGLPRLESVPIDATVLMFALAVVTISGVVMGIVPAWRLARTDVRTLLNENTRGTSSGIATSRLMSGLIVAEVALSIALVAGAGWLVQSFARLRAVDAGFAAGGRLVVDVRPTQRLTDPKLAHAYMDDLHDRVRSAVSGAKVGSGSIFPLRGDQVSALNVELDGEPVDPGRMRGAQLRFATPGYFEAMGIKLVSGRTFTDDDRPNTERVAVVNRAFVRQYFPDRDPLAGAFAFGYPKVDRKGMTRIVGVVDDVRFKSLAQPDESTFYLPSRQNPFPIIRPAIVIAASAGSASALIEPVREALNRFDPTLVVTFTTADAIVAATTRRQQLGMTLMLVFGAMALTLAAVGIYGVIAYAVEQRRTELATRIALGAPSAQVFRMLLGAGQRLAIIGVVLGIAAAYAAGTVVATYLYEMRAADPLVLIGSGLIVAAVTIGVTIIPAIRASRVDPVRALRSA